MRSAAAGTMWATVLLTLSALLLFIMNGATNEAVILSRPLNRAVTSFEPLVTDLFSGFNSTEGMTCMQCPCGLQCGSIPTWIVESPGRRMVQVECPSITLATTIDLMQRTATNAASADASAGGASVLPALPPLSRRPTLDAIARRKVDTGVRALLAWLREHRYQLTPEEAQALRSRTPSGHVAATFVLHGFP